MDLGAIPIWRSLRPLAELRTTPLHCALPRGVSWAGPFYCFSIVLSPFLLLPSSFLLPSAFPNPLPRSSSLFLFLAPTCFAGLLAISFSSVCHRTSRSASSSSPVPSFSLSLWGIFPCWFAIHFPMGSLKSRGRTGLSLSPAVHNDCRHVEFVSHL